MALKTIDSDSLLDKGGSLFSVPKKAAEAVLVYESKVVTKKKVSAFPIFPQNHGVL